MSPRQSNIADMQYWLLRMTQNRWSMPASEVTRIFRECRVHQYINGAYDLLHRTKLSK